MPQDLSGFGVGQTNPSLWTIPVEIGFHVVPVIYGLIIGRFRTSISSFVLGVAAIVSFALWYFAAFLALGTEAGRAQLAPDMTAVPAAVTILLQTPLPHLYWFLVGVLLWRNFDTIERVLRDRVMIWTIAYAVFAYAPIWLDARSARQTVVYQLIRVLLLALWALSFAFSFGGVSHRLLRGWDLSYGLYLFHMLVINTFVELGFAAIPSRYCSSTPLRRCWPRRPGNSWKSQHWQEGVA